MKRSQFWIAAMMAGLFGAWNVSFGQEHAHQKATQPQEQIKEVYSCPMDSDVVSDKPGNCSKCGMKLEKRTQGGTDKQGKMSDMMRKPTFEKSVDGILVQVWLIPQEEHKKMMGSMMQTKKDSSGGGHMIHGENKHDMSKMDHGMMGLTMNHDMDSVGHGKGMEAMMTGTHHVMATLTDEKTKQPLENVAVTLEVISPLAKSSFVKLSSMMNHFGGGTSLNEKGKYSLVVTIEKEKKPLSLSFTYEAE